jgi:hypothetical protein
LKRFRDLAMVAGIARQMHNPVDEKVSCMSQLNSYKTCLLLAAAAMMAASAPTAAHAKVCKDEVTAKSRSAAQYSDADRQSRARDGAIANWRDRARSTYGIAYRFWSRAENKSVECASTKSAGTCVAKARPCRLL